MLSGPGMIESSKSASVVAQTESCGLSPVYNVFKLPWLAASQPEHARDVTESLREVFPRGMTFSRFELSLEGARFYSPSYRRDLGNVTSSDSTL